MNLDYIKKIEGIILSPVAGKGAEIEMFGAMLNNPSATLEQYASKCPAGVKSSTISTRFKLDKIVLSSVAVKLSKEGLLGNISDALRGIILSPVLGKGLQTIAIKILSDNPTISDTEFKTIFEKVSKESGLTPSEATVTTYYRDMRFRVQQAIKTLATLPVAIALPENTPAMAMAIAPAPAPAPAPETPVKASGKGKAGKTK